MGGSSGINFMLYTRGNKYDYDQWESLGNAGWAYKDLLKYFIKLENDTLHAGNKLRGKYGPIKVSHFPFRSSIGKAFIESGKELGYENLDYNLDQQISMSRWQTNTYKGKRWSTNRGYLHPARDRENLSITRNSHVTKILINPSTKKAYGVKFVKNKQEITVTVKKEVILCWSY